MRLLALAAACLVLVSPLAAASLEPSAAYLAARRQADGGFAERGSASDPNLTAWVSLALRAAGREPAGAARYLRGQPYPETDDLALRIVALAALGEPVEALAEQLEGLRRASGRIGPAVNSTLWSVLALRAAGRPAGASTVRYLLRQQRSGGWSWAEGVAPDSNDTAIAVQALRASGVSGKPIARGLAFLRGMQNRDGGFGLVRGRASDAQSTAWTIQGFLAAGAKPPPAAYRYLQRLRRTDGSFRYSAKYVTTPVWVTAQVLPALAGKTFPLRPRSGPSAERTSGRGLGKPEGFPS